MSDIGEAPKVPGQHVDPEDLQLAASRVAIMSANALGRLDTLLRETQQPLPALNIFAYPHDGNILLPGVWVGFGSTEPGEGLRPTAETRFDNTYPSETTPKPVVKAGLSIPLHKASLGGATFFPFPFREDDEGGPESFWQRWYPTGYVMYVPGEEPQARMVDEDARAVEVEPQMLTTWLNKQPPFHGPAVMFDGGPGVISSVALEAWNDHRMIAVGSSAVGTTLRSMLKGLVGDDPPPLLEPLRDMVETVADALEVQL